MKKLTLSIIFIISIISCTKKANKVSNTTQSTQTTDLSGTWINQTNATDYFGITNASNNRAVLSHFSQYNYAMSQGSHLMDTTTYTILTTVPGYDMSYYTGSPVNSPEPYNLLYIAPNMVITIQHNNGTVTTYKFNKQ
jgi:hypothetical protein